jgi:hypothetical protein
MLHETKCTPFCGIAGEGFVRGEERSYLMLRVQEDVAFDRYLRAIQAEIQQMLNDLEIQSFMKWPYDVISHTLRIKVSMSHGRIDVECFDVDSRDALPSASLSDAKGIAVRMQLSDLWIGKKEIAKTGIVPT